MTEQHGEEKKLVPFVWDGTKAKREVEADKVLKDIADGEDIFIEDAVIKGDLDIRKIKGHPLSPE